MNGRNLRRLQSDAAGNVTVEYTVLLVAVALASAGAILSIGMPLVSRYRFMKLLIGLPLP